MHWLCYKCTITTPSKSSLSWSHPGELQTVLAQGLTQRTEPATHFIHHVNCSFPPRCNEQGWHLLSPSYFGLICSEKSRHSGTHIFKKKKTVFLQHIQTHNLLRFQDTTSFFLRWKICSAQLCWDQKIKLNPGWNELPSRSCASQHTRAAGRLGRVVKSDFSQAKHFYWFDNHQHFILTLTKIPN